MSTRALRKRSVSRKRPGPRAWDLANAERKAINGVRSRLRRYDPKCVPSADELRALLSAQGGVCYYTGAPIAFGSGASVDHVVPKSRGGTNALRNLRIVHVNVNFAKRDLPESEFLSMVRLIADRFPRSTDV